MCVQFALYEHLTIYEYHITCVHIQVKIKGDTNVNSTQHTQTDWRKRFDDVIVSYLYLYTVCRHVNFFLYKKNSFWCSLLPFGLHFISFPCSFPFTPTSPIHSISLSTKSIGKSVWTLHNWITHCIRTDVIKWNKMRTLSWERETNNRDENVIYSFLFFCTFGQYGGYALSLQHLILLCVCVCLCLSLVNQCTPAPVPRLSATL